MDDFDLTIENIIKDEQEPEILFLRPELLNHPNIPKPMHGVNPRTVMGAKWWNEKRREAYAKNNYHCWVCGMYAPYDKRNLRFHDVKLDAHEFYAINYELKTMELMEIVAVCKNCHGYIHSGRLQSLYDKGDCDEETCWQILNHGDSILIDAGYPPYNEVDDRDYELEWDDWRLVIGYDEYPPVRTFKEWGEKYGNDKRV